MEETEGAPPRPRNKVQMALATLMIVLLLGTQLISHRPRAATNRPWVAHVADVPEEKVDLVGDYVGSGTAIPADRYDPPFGMRAKTDTDKPLSPPKLGYSFREVGLLGMPLFAYTDKGFVIYAEDDTKFMMTPINEEGRKVLGDGMTPVGKDYVFPFWDYLWGWSLILLVLGWVFVWWRSDKKYRAETGAI